MPARASRKPTRDENLLMRRELGQWLKQKREAAGLTQRALAVELGLDYYTFVSQLESGRGRIPSDLYIGWANALQIPPREFLHSIMRYYEPVMFQILFEQDERGESSPTDKAGHDRQWPWSKWASNSDNRG